METPPRETRQLDSVRLGALIHIIRGQRVMLDRDLARLYGVSVKAFNQAVRRQKSRFPPDFMLELDEQETRELRARLLATDPSVLMGLRVRAVVSRNQQLARRLESVERRLSSHEGRLAEQSKQIRAVFEAIERLLAPSLSSQGHEGPIRFRRAA